MSKVKLRAKKYIHLKELFGGSKKEQQKKKYREAQVMTRVEEGWKIIVQMAETGSMTGDIIKKRF